MNIVQITPGAGGMYCGNCFRDNTLVHELRRLGHSTLMVPLYLPMTLDEKDESKGTPIFFSGINVYLEQLFPLFAKAPNWLRKPLASPTLLKWASGRAAKTRAQDLGELTYSIIQGENGNQATELSELIAWLKSNHRPDVICLSNALLAGLACKLKEELGAPVVCVLQGEDSFLDSLPDRHRTRAWNALSERARDIDSFIAPSNYFAQLMTRRLNLSPARVRVVYNGINPEGFAPAPNPPHPPTIGFFARMCPEKGLDLLVNAFIELKQRATVPGLRLLVGGSLGPADEAFVAKLKKLLEAGGCLQDVEFFPNLSRADKQDFFRKLTLFSVPALYGEAFGLYLAEAWVSGIPVVQPRHAAFPELVEESGGGDIVEGNTADLANGLEKLLTDPERARELGRRAREVALDQFTAESMTRGVLELFADIIASASHSPQVSSHR